MKNLRIDYSIIPDDVAAKVKDLHDNLDPDTAFAFVKKHFPKALIVMRGAQAGVARQFVLNALVKNDAAEGIRTVLETTDPDVLATMLSLAGGPTDQNATGIQYVTNVLQIEESPESEFYATVQLHRRTVKDKTTGVAVPLNTDTATTLEKTGRSVQFSDELREATPAEV